MSTWSGRRVERARAVVATWLPAPCGKCNKPVTPQDKWNVGHKVDRWARPDLIDVPTNWQAEHRACSDASGQSAVIAKAKAEALREHGIVTDFSHGHTPRESPPLLSHTHGTTGSPLEIREGLTWTHFTQHAPTWLSDVLEVPEDAAPPLAMTPPHPEATGSYGKDACEWMEENLTERGRPLRLRWWQRLAVYRQLEHDSSGALCWRFILESTPRQVGKSTRLRGMALWRIAVGPTLFEGEQLVMGTGRALSICREIMRKGYPWAEARRDEGWSYKKGMTEPEIAYEELNRWIVRSKDDTTGYSPSLALVDESWDVAPSVIDDDLEPSMTERLSPQLLLTSTAHRKATSLMRGRMSNALAAEDGETLLLWWGAAPGADIASPETQRAASPYWSQARAAVAAAAYARALSGESDPEADDPDPMQAYLCQILNIWPLKQRKAQPGHPVMTPDEWESRQADLPSRPCDSAAIEGWFSEGVALARVWRDPETGVPILNVTTHPDLETLGESLGALLEGYRGQVGVGASLATSEALKSRVRLRPENARTAPAVVSLSHMQWQHADSPALKGQLLGIRLLPGDPPRLAGPRRADGIKAAFWALEEARKPVRKWQVITV